MKIIATRLNLRELKKVSAFYTIRDGVHYAAAGQNKTSFGAGRWSQIPETDVTHSANCRTTFTGYRNLGLYVYRLLVHSNTDTGRISQHREILKFALNS